MANNKVIWAVLLVSLEASFIYEDEGYNSSKLEEIREFCRSSNTYYSKYDLRISF